MDYEKLSKTMSDVLADNSITDVLMCIEIRLKDKVDELDKQYLESQLANAPVESLRVAPMRLSRLLNDVSVAKRTAFMVE